MNVLLWVIKHSDTPLKEYPRNVHVLHLHWGVPIIVYLFLWWFDFWNLFISVKRWNSSHTFIVTIELTTNALNTSYKIMPDIREKHPLFHSGGKVGEWARQRKRESVGGRREGEGERAHGWLKPIWMSHSPHLEYDVTLMLSWLDLERARHEQHWSRKTCSIPSWSPVLHSHDINKVTCLLYTLQWMLKKLVIISAIYLKLHCETGAAQ